MSDEFRLSGNSGIPQPLTPIKSLGKVELRPVNMDNAEHSAFPPSRVAKSSVNDSAARQSEPNPTKLSE